MLRHTLYTALLGLLPASLFAQIAISPHGAQPHASAMLDVDIASLPNNGKKGLLLPRITRAQRDLIIAPADGLVIMQTNDGPGPRYYDANLSMWLLWNPAAWNLTGNFGSDHTQHFVGTLDTNTMRIRVGDLGGAGFDLTTQGQWLPFNPNSSVYMGWESGYNAGQRANEFNIYIGNAAGTGPNYSHPDSSYYSVGVGASALLYQTKGTGNTGMGRSALMRNQRGLHNTAIGAGSDILGVFDWHHYSDGVALGSGAALGQSTVAVGNSSRSGAASGYTAPAPSTGALALGASSRADSSASSAIGHAAHADDRAVVRFGNANVHAIGAYAPWTMLSDIRFKQNSAPLLQGTALLNDLQAISYRVDRAALGGTTEDHSVHAGFSAQALLAALQKHAAPSAAVSVPGTGDGQYGVAYTELIAHLVVAMQEREARNQLLAQRIAALQQAIQRIENKHP